MRLKIGEIEVEGADEKEIEFLLGKVDALRGVVPAINNTAPAIRAIPLATEGRIRRTRDEQARGLTPEQAIEERKASQNADTGATFDGELSLDEVPTD